MLENNRLNNYRFNSYSQTYRAKKDGLKVENKAKKPWLYQRMWGIPREVDCLDLRRLALAPIAQVCISTKRSFVKNTPWLIVETDQADIKTKKILDMSPFERTQDKTYMEMRTKAINETPANTATEEVSQLFAAPNTSNKPFSHFISMALNDIEEVGCGTWVLKFDENDMEKTTNISNEPVITPKKDAKPIMFDSFDNL